MIKSDFVENRSPDSQAISSESLQENNLDRQAGSAKKVKQKPKTKRIESFPQLVHLVYDNAFKRSQLKASEVKALRLTSLIDASERQEMLDSARRDMSLEKTRQLMLLGLKTDGVIAMRITEFSCEVLRRHPFFQIEPLLNAISRVDEDALEINIIDTILARNNTELEFQDCDMPLTKKSFKNMQINAAHCLLLYLAMKNASILKIHSLFQRLIRPKAGVSSLVNEQVYTLITTRSPEAAAVTSRLLEAQLADQKRIAREADTNKKRAEVRAEILEGKVCELGKDLEACKQDLSLLKNTSEQAEKDHNAEKVHWRDDYEQLRGNVLRRMKEEVALLDEGLHALRKDPPKIHVMIDHAERAIDGLKREMERIRRGD